MLTRYWDRRRFIRVPVTGPARWQSGRYHGHCELLDISPAGAGLRMPVRPAKQLGPRITIEIEVTPGVNRPLARDARVVRRQVGDDGLCVVGVQF
jgi:hypothetical protein